MGENTYLTAEQLAELLQISSKTVYRLAAKDPSMPTLRLGGSIRFPRERLERWLRDREQGPGRARQLTKDQVLSRAKPAERQGSA